MKNLRVEQRKIKAVFVLVCAFVLLAGVQAQAVGVQIFINGNILTMNDEQPTAEAVAVKDGKILAVGSRTDVEKAAGSGAEVVDLGGKTLMPGSIDSHSHLGLVGTKLALANMDHPPAGPITSIEDIKKGFREWIKEKNIKYIRAAVLIAALCMIALGIRNGEVGVVLTKATSICLQCIGIG